MFKWRGLIGKKRADVNVTLPNLRDEDVLVDYATTFSHLKEHGLEKLLGLLEANAALEMRTFRDVKEHSEMCRLQGMVGAYLSVREVVDNIIEAHKQRLEEEQDV